MSQRWKITRLQMSNLVKWWISYPKRIISKQYGNLKIILPFRFYVKSILAIFKNGYLIFSAHVKIYTAKFLHFWRAQNYQNQIWQPLFLSKQQFLRSGWKILKFPHCIKHFFENWKGLFRFTPFFHQTRLTPNLKFV